MAWNWLSECNKPPLPPLLRPEAVGTGRDERKYLSRVLDESRSVLDAPLEGFVEVSHTRGFRVYRKPVSSGKGVSECRGRCRSPADCGQSLALQPLLLAAAAAARCPPPCAAHRKPPAPRCCPQLTMARLEAEVPMAADDLFALMTSMEGKVHLPYRTPAPWLVGSQPFGESWPPRKRSSCHAPCCLLPLPQCIVDPFPREHHSELVKVGRRRRRPSSACPPLLLGCSLLPLLPPTPVPATQCATPPPQPTSVQPCPSPPGVQPLRLPGGEAAVVFSEAPRFAGLLRPREYVTCDAAAPGERLFVCKSCRVEEGLLAAPRRGAVRANLLFAMRMSECGGRAAGAPPRCRMQVSGGEGALGRGGGLGVRWVGRQRHAWRGCAPLTDALALGGRGLRVHAPPAPCLTRRLCASRLPLPCGRCAAGWTWAGARCPPGWQTPSPSAGSFPRSCGG